ncbi:protealysin inhibitor emfourin [Streptomyces sp. PR69]|uniref:protealysin inhibitor emfourin n=1 Tax=Streptomyces sp. PR69 TaxID=2984950 RepID=UPI0022656DBF|nr:protealysin inhibitor emfourin [Streptomyces sp. PR69]
MRIQVRRTGGFGGIERFAELDTAGRADADELQELARQVLAEGHRTPPVGVPDGFSYQITVEGETVYATDPRLSEGERRLMSVVLKEGA